MALEAQSAGRTEPNFSPNVNGSPSEKQSYSSTDGGAAMRRFVGPQVVWFIGLLTVVVLAAIFTPLPELWANPKRIAAAGAGFSDEWWMPLAALSAYLLGAVFLFPITVLIFATAYLFEPVLGFFIALTGVTLSGAGGYLFGNRLGARRISKLLDKPFRKISALTGEQGVLWVAVVRHVPIAPFTIVNLAIGCTKVSLVQFLAGTIIGLAPSIFAIMLFKQGLVELLVGEGGVKGVALTIGGAAMLVALGFGLSRLLKRRLELN